MSSRVLVTGGAGFIGSHICDYFLSEKAQVVALDNLSSGSPENLKSAVDLKVLDIRSAEAAAFIKDFSPDIIVHAAAQMSVSDSMKDPAFDADVNIRGLINLLSAVKESGKPSYFIFISTGGALYGEQDVYPAPETHVIRPTSFYGLSKHVGELYLDLWQRSYGLNYGVLRLANVYGPRQNPHGEAGVVAIFNKMLLSGKTPTIHGSGEQTRDYVFVADVVSALAKLAKRGQRLTLNIGTGIETSVNTLYSKILQALGIDCVAEHGPARSGDQLRSCISANLARSELNWVPNYTLEQGLKLTSDWFKQQS